MKEMKKILKKSIKNLKISENFIQKQNLKLLLKPLFSENLIKNKIGFFRRLKKSVFKFEEYEKFLEEDLKKAFAYFFKLLAVFSFFVTI